MPDVEFFFDHTCPYCDRGHQALMALLPKYPGVRIVFRPIEAHPKDEEPWHKPYADLAVQGALFFRDRGLDELAYHERLYRAAFRERRAVDDTATLTALAEELGADGAAFRAALESGAFAKAQRAANDHAYRKNRVWAVPTFVSGWKRLDAVEGVGVSKEGMDRFLKACCEER